MFSGSLFLDRTYVVQIGSGYFLTCSLVVQASRYKPQCVTT